MDNNIQKVHRNYSDIVTNDASFPINSPNYETEKPIDLYEYWRVILKYKWNIFFLSVSVSMLATLMVFNITPIYRSTATMLIESKPYQFINFQNSQVPDYFYNNTEYLSTQCQILKSTSLARRVVEKLNLVRHPAFMPKQKVSLMPDWEKWFPSHLKQHNAPKKVKLENDPLLPLSRVIASGITVIPRRETQLVDIHFDAEDAVLAKDIVNALGEAYIESNVDVQVELSHKASGWLADRLEGLRQKVIESEKNLQDYLKQENLVDLQGILTISAKEIEGSTGKLVEARNSLAEAETLYNKVRNVDVNKHPELIPEVYMDSIVQSLKQEESVALRKLSELQERYGSEHPSLVAAQSELQSIQKLIKQQIISIVATIKNRYEVARANEIALSAGIEKNKTEIQVLGRKQTRLQELQREIEVNRNLYEVFLTRFKETSTADHLHNANARFIDRAIAADAPYKPDIQKIVSMVFLTSLLIGVGLAFLQERTDNALRAPEDVENKLGVPLLGIVPIIKKIGKHTNIDSIYLEGKNISFCESIKTIRTSIILSNLDRKKKVILITSTLPGEGKSTLCLTLASSLGQMERVLLLEADLRRPSIKKLIKIDENSKLGLTNILAHQAEIEDCIFSPEGYGIDIIHAGMVPPNPLELLSTKSFQNFLLTIRESYDTILIDSPPVHVVSDAQVLAQYVDSVIYICESDRIPVKTIQAGVRELKQFQSPIAGVIINKSDFRKFSYGHDKYAYYRYGYYEEN